MQVQTPPEQRTASKSDQVRIFFLQNLGASLGDALSYEEKAF
jgi:hypothetical protein